MLAPAYTRALITGSTSGIGLAVAERLGRERIQVGNLSFDQAEVEATVAALRNKGIDAFPVTADLSQPDDVTGLLARIEERHGPIDILVNSAGIGLQASVPEIRDEDMRRLFEVNFFAMVTLCRDALVSMAFRGRGHIINVSSASARRALPGLAIYAASKAAMHAFSQALRVEAKPHGVYVTELLPMSVRTPFFANAQNRSNRSYEVGGFATSPEHVAERVWRAIRHPVPEVYTSTLSRLVLALDAIDPRLFEAILAAHERREKPGA